MENKKAKAAGYQSIIAYLSMKNADKAIEFYKKAFGATENGKIMMPGNRIGHAELQIGDSRIMLAEEMPEWGNKSPETLKGSPVGIFLYVEDVDAVFKKALDAGAKVKGEMTVKDQFYGDRSGNLVDPFGHEWIIGARVKDMSWEEMQKAFDDMLKETKK